MPIATSPDQGTNVVAAVQNVSADGAISIPANARALVVITKGTALAGTLAAPVAVTDDYKLLIITSATAAAHVITSGVRGFNGKASSGTATFGAAKGNGMVLMAFNGDWYNVSATGITYA